jgi:glycosyltransferase involved in cell wall biosynthesis
MDKDASYGKRLRHLAADLPQICFRGTYARADSAQIYAGLDVLVVPSLWYDFPLVMHEAFATQTPVIATNLGGMAETVTPGKDGLLFERGNVDDLAKQLQRIIEEPNLLQRLRAGTPRVKRIDEAVNELESIYHDLIERRTKPDWGLGTRA